MNYDNIDNLISEIESGYIDYNTLSGDEFQKVVAEIVIRKYLHCQDCSVSDRERRPVDIIIEHKMSFYNSSKKIMHYIECKNYQHTLDMETIGKVLCFAIKEKPMTLLFVNRYNTLSSDAKEYTNWLFNNYILDNVNFDIISPDKLLLGDFFNTKENKKKKNFVINIDKWEIKKEKIFFTEKAATNLSNTSEIIIDKNYNYILRVLLSYENLNQRKIKDIHLQFRYKDDIEKTTIYKRIERINKNKIVANTQIVEINLFEVFQHIEKKLESFILTIESTAGSDTKKLNLPHFKESQEVLLPNLRVDIMKKYSKQIYENNNKNIIFVKGEAGVGKTYFCESICNEMTHKYDYNSYIFTINEETTYAIFLDLLHAYIYPNHFSKDNLKSLPDEFKKEYINSLISLLNIDGLDYKKISQAILDETLNTDTTEIIIRLIGNIISQSTDKKILVFTNCQKFSNTTLRVFRQLISALESKGWNKLKIIFEYRDSEEEYKEIWNQFKSWVNLDLSIKVINIKLSPFKEHYLLNWIQESFNIQNSTYISKILLNKTGGNALFLTHIIEELKTHNIIHFSNLKSNSKLIEIPSLKAFEKTLEELPSNIEELLLLRLSYIDDFIRDKNAFKDIKYLLGISAIVGLTLNEKIILETFKITKDKYRKIIRMLVSKKILKDSRNETIIFAHEMIRVATKGYLNNDDKLIDYYYNLVDITDDTNHLDLLIFKAKVSEFIEAYSDAIKYYSLGYEVSVNNELFDWQFLFANGEYLLLKNNSEFRENNERKYFELINYISWAEEHIGSYLNSFNISLNGVEQLRQSIDSNLNDLQALYYHKIIGLSIELLKPDEFYKYIIKALNTVENSTKLGQILNRAILQCSQSGHFQEGIRIAKIALMLAPQSKDNSVYAVLCTDISTLYSNINPKHSLKLCQKSLIMNVDKRQMIQNKIATMSMQIRINPKLINMDELNNIKIAVRELKMNNVLPRIYNIEAGINIYSNKLSIAIDLLKDAEFNSSLYDHYSEQLKIINNLIICYLTLEDYDNVTKYYSKFYRIIQQYVEKHPENSKDIIHKVIVELEKKYINSKNNNFDTTYFDEETHVQYPHLLSLYILNLNLIVKSLNKKHKIYPILYEIQEFFYSNNLFADASLSIEKYNINDLDFILSF